MCVCVSVCVCVSDTHAVIYTDKHKHLSCLLLQFASLKDGIKAMDHLVKCT